MDQVRTVLETGDMVQSDGREPVIEESPEGVRGKEANAIEKLSACQRPQDRGVRQISLLAGVHVTGDRSHESTPSGA